MMDNVVVVVLTLSVLGAVVKADVECWDYCEGKGDTTGECNARHNISTCTGKACRITKYRDYDILDRGCVQESDPGGVYSGLCFSGMYLGAWLVSCQCDDAAGNGSYCNEEFQSVTCADYCVGNDDPSGWCQSRHTYSTCTGVTCRVTNWHGSDIYASDCLVLNDQSGLLNQDCYDAEFQGNDVTTCQCDETECNVKQLISSASATYVSMVMLGVSMVMLGVMRALQWSL